MKTELKVGQEVFYNNLPVWIESLYDKKAVISFWVGDNEDGDVITQVVPQSSLSRDKVDIGKEFAAKMNEAKNIKARAESDAYSIKAKAEAEVREIRERAKKYKGFEAMLDFLDGTIKYLVYCRYSDLHVINAEDAKCDYDKHELAAVLYRSKGNKVTLMLSEYSDGSGHSSYECAAFKTTEEIKAHLAELLPHLIQENKLTERNIGVFTKYGIESPAFAEYLEESRKIQIKGYEREIAEKEAKIAESKIKILELGGDTCATIQRVKTTN